MPARWPFGAGSTSTIRARIQWLVVACTVPMALLAVVLLVLSYQRGREALLQSNLQAARTLAQAVERELDANLQVLQALATSRSIDERDFERFHAQARETLKHVAADNIVLFDTELRGLASAAHEWGTPLPQVRHDRFPQVLSTGQPAVSTVFVGQVSRQQQVAVAVPVVRGGRAVARLEMVFGLERFADMLARQNIAPQWTGAVLDSQGTIVARTRDPQQYVGKPASPRFYERVRSAAEGSFDSVTADGVAVAATFSRGARHGWTGAIGVPQRDLQAQLQRSLWLAGATAVLLLGSGLLLARAIGRRIAAPIQALVQPALAVGRGEKADVAESTLHEASELGRALAQAQALLVEREQARQKAEATSKQAEELRLHSVRLEAENRQIQEANRLKNEFLANMSHELRTPLNAVIGFAEILRGDAGKLAPGKRAAYIDHIVASGRHLLRLINDVLDLSKVESGKFDLVPETIALPQVVQEVVSVLQPEASRKGVQMESQVDPALVEVVLDPARLKQMLYNLLSNAIKFTEAGGRVWLRARPEGAAQLCIEVEDTGIGIAPEDLPKLFRQFQQLHTGLARAYAGTGLGLVLTRRLAELHGGAVGVRSTPGRGSVFHLVLPLRMGATPAAREPRPPPQFTAAPDAPTVLVVEDDATTLELMVATLQTLGIAAREASSAVQALEMIEREPPDAMILDLVMPGMNGFDLLYALRARPRWQALPVFVWTGLQLDAAETATLKVSAQAVVAKAGGGLETLVRQLRAWQAQREQGVAP